MTNNKVIINGVEVSKCEFYNVEDSECSIDDKYDFIGYTVCQDYSNCYYKQLARKTQECEKLKSALEEIEEIAITDCGFCTDYKCGRMKNILDFINKAKEQE